MKPVSLEKQSVAWFKLAECVGRGEKERTLSLFRLLTYSLDNKPFTKQLEADILAFFEDKQALTEYVSAAHLYYQEGNIVEASVVYEKLIALESKQEFLEKVISLYFELKDQKKAIYYQKQLCTVLLSKGRVEKAVMQFKSFEENLDEGEKIDLYKAIITAALTHKYGQQKTITEYLHKALDGLMRFGSDQELKTFLADLKALNTLWHKDAVEYLKK
jgi:hypothetical protein